MSRTIIQRLRHARGILQVRRWIALLLHGGLATAIILLVFAAFNRWWRPVQEESAFLIIMAAMAGFVVYAAWVSHRVWRRPPSLPTLAARVEEEQPHWMDALICATELEEKPETGLRPLERTLVERMERKSAGVDFEAALIPARWKNKPLLLSLATMAFLASLLLSSSFIQKGGHFFTDLATGQASGIRVLPGDGETPVRTDVRISANVIRWENSPQIEYIDETGRHRFPMHHGSEGHSFVFYDLEEDVRYRVLTPSLRSPWYRISPYTPPAIDRVGIHVTPPAYTGLPNESFDRLQGVTAVEGSQIKWEIASPTAAAATLRASFQSGDLPFLSEELAVSRKDAGVAHVTMEASAEDIHSVSISLLHSFLGRFVIEDDAGRSARTQEFPVAARPDLPPTIEVTQPGRDTAAEPTGQVPIAALAADDFGLTEISLYISISGRRQPPVRLFESARTDDEEIARVTERTVRAHLDMEALETEEGDVVVYFLTAADNREPEGQLTRSEVYFVEVREQVLPEEREGEAMELEQIDLQALIVELKRLIRLSWEAVSRYEERVEREIAAGLEEVRLETARVQQAIVAQVGAEAAEGVVALMNRSMRRMETASQLVDQRLVDDSIPYQEMALADLVFIQNELMKNQSTSDEPSERETGERSAQQEETERDDYLDELQRLMSAVQRLSDDQAVQNTAMRRMADLNAAQQAEFGQRQESIQEQTAQVNRDLSRLPGTERAQRDLHSAEASMQSASRRIDANQPEAAGRDGDRARSSILSALDHLEETMAEASGNQIAQLARQAQEMAQQQDEAAGGSRGLAECNSPSSEEGAALRQQQQALQNQLQQLLSAMDDTANQLRETHPEAARSVAEAGQDIRDQNVGSEMGRAANALLYRRYDRAADIQESIAEDLGLLAESLDASAGMMPSMTSQQLQQLLSQVQQAQQEVMSMTGQSPDDIRERLEQIASNLSRRLSRAGRALSDPTLQEVSGELGAMSEDDHGPNIFRMDGMLRAAARSLEQQIFALEIERRARLQRQVAEPPEHYRGLVEEYFKNLSESP